MFYILLKGMDFSKVKLLINWVVYYLKMILYYRENLYLYFGRVNKECNILKDV